MNEKMIEKRLLKMQQAVLHKLSDTEGASTQTKQSSPDKPSEQNIDIDNLEVLFSLDQDSRRRLNRINHALNRLHRKEYHRCSQCGADLSEQRLELEPLTDLCEICESKQPDISLH